MKELSIFVDEAGVFTLYQNGAIDPYKNNSDKLITVF